MIDNNMTNERLRALFETHPGVDVVFIAADGMPFLYDLAAQSHAQRLFDKNVLEISREDLEDYSPETFADGLGGEIIPAVAPLHPSIAGPYSEFLQTQGGGFTPECGGVIVPPSNILAHEEQTPRNLVHEALAAAIAQVRPIAEATAEKIAPLIMDIASQSGAKPDSEQTPGVSALEVAYNTPEAERTPTQKGLITKDQKAKAAVEEKGEAN
ncbi:hypothetical protein [Mucilaginibacter rubeus]|uniref:Uncharacterized protein n=1 Tax=Mucilaginibacter rubeus TaxID=2027860 RepID=A0A5C1I7F3_9SPHI|nr:hypothetical protein [Mucilaginibacter rubeus]QEM13478.1 hypothetical protein DEO27_026860 [Mucilaginibacter rubeus]